MNKLKNIMINFSTNYYKTVIFLILLFTIITGSFIPLITIDTDPENMLQNNEPARIFHNKTKKQFELSDTVVIGIINEKHPDGVFNPETLSRIYELTQFAKKLSWQNKKNPNKFEGVIEVDMIAPSLVDHIGQQDTGIIKFEWLMSQPPATKEEALLIRDKALSNPLLKNIMVSENGKAICIYLPLTDKLLSYQIYTELNNKIKEIAGDEDYHIMGLPVAEGAIGIEMFTQMKTASPLTMLVIFSLLLLFFRKLALIILPMMIAAVSVISTMGMLIGFGFPVHILSSMLPIFLMSIAMVDSVHVLSEFYDVYTPEKGRKQSIIEVMNTLFAPMFYTSLTTAAGFLSLILAPIPPAQVFGGFLSIGVMIAWLITIILVPAYIMIIPEKKFKNFGMSFQQKEKKSWLTKTLKALGNLTYNYAKPVLGILVILIIAAIWGITQIQINDNYAKRFAKSHPIRKADIALNNHFGGTYTAYLILEGKNTERPVNQDIQTITKKLSEYALNIADEYENAPKMADGLKQKFSDFRQKDYTIEDFLNSIIEYIEKISISASDKEYYTWQELKNFIGVEKEKLKIFKQPEVLQYMSNLQLYMEQTGLIGKSISIADIVKKVNQELLDGKPENFRIPNKLQGIAECYMQFQQSHRPNDLWHMVTPDYMHANIQMQFKNGDSKTTKEAVDAVDEYFSNNKPPAGLNYRWAGLHYINLVLESRLVWGFLKSFIGSFFIVFIMMSILFRSPLWGFLCMVPLTITLITIYGVTGIIGKDYDLPIAVLSALSIGMSVDFAIHFLERSRSAYSQTGSWKKIFPMMFGEPARAISRNVVVIAIGFLPLLAAPLIPYKTTGIMLFAILSTSGFITLIALPVILTIAEKKFFKIIKPESVIIKSESCICR